MSQMIMVLKRSLGTTASDREGVQIPSSRAHVSDEQLSELQECVDPLSDGENFGIDLYQQAVQLINMQP